MTASKNDERKIIVLDIETDSLDIDEIENVWCVVVRENEEVCKVFSDYDDSYISIRYLREYLYDKIHDGYYVVGHNILGFDLRVLKSIDILLPSDRIIDTLVVSRLLNYNIEGGHSLEAWGERLGCPKFEFDRFDEFSKEMVDYCIQDTLVSLKLYERFEKHIDRFWKSVWLEHRAQEICIDMEEIGFPFDIERAERYKKEIEEEELSPILSRLQNEIPPLEIFVRAFKPKLTKKGIISKVGFSRFGHPEFRFYQVDDDFNRVRLHKPSDIDPNRTVYVYRVERFNPHSSKHVLMKCWEWGWNPVNKTKGHIRAERERDEEALRSYEIWGWKIDEENLSTLSPEAPDVARDLVRYLTLSSRLSMLDQWIDLYNPKTKRIHGRFMHIGSWTHRMSHQNPNMANIPAVDRDTPYAKEFRSLWIAPEGSLLLGCDADGIQMRIFAHYAEDDDLIHAILEGKKEDGTDVHSLHAKKLGGVERDKAKTFIYAWLLGAGVKKISEILGCSVNEAKERVEEFLASYPKLKELKNKKIPMMAAKGWFEAIDGSPIICKSEHLMLAGMLQSGEAKAMKLANYIWRRWAEDEGIPFQQVNFVHDEWQTLVLTEDESVATRLGELQAEAIKLAGEKLNVRCPLSGSYRIGKNWAETH